MDSWANPRYSMSSNAADKARPGGTLLIQAVTPCPLGPIEIIFYRTGMGITSDDQPA